MVKHHDGRLQGCADGGWNGSMHIRKGMRALVKKTSYSPCLMVASIVFMELYISGDDRNICSH